jgi:hypothetical protein
MYDVMIGSVCVLLSLLTEVDCVLATMEGH